MGRTQFVIGLAVMAVMSLAGGFFAVAVLVAPEPAEAQASYGVIKGTAFDLVDRTGRSRARLDVGPSGSARFTLLDQMGRARVLVSAEDEKSVFSLLDSKGTPRYVASQTEGDDRVSVIYSDRGGNERHLSALTNEGDSLVAFTGPGDEKWVTLLAGPEQASTLILADPKSGQNVVTFAGRGQASLQISDKEGKGGYLASVLGDGRPVFALSKAGKLRIRGMTDEDGTPRIEFVDDARRPTWSAGK